ncbi:flagellar motor switch protein FliM [Ammonifex degensii KC4]|uniref:Flagellar motor switch protein FliM n=1 Tax=Ammonifex degensii (strain DSM 10501 / KC4) TaxID=429009 RepID=C9R9W7_AMMDK|nr:flagellar motor switch protein FliM [Ammonifex degensii]ACX53096.1 flagellar motor switch protein FliM [Ammonifex degensii KC4]
MAEVLSQAEIDALLAALASGELPKVELPSEEKAVPKKYDFRRPNKFSKEQLRTLQLLHENWARILSGFLSGYLRTNISVTVSGVDQLTFDDFIRSLPAPTLLIIFTLEPLPGAAVMETNPSFLFPVIDLLFGGPGEMPEKIREFTEIEVSVGRKLAEKLLENLSFAWRDVFKVTPAVEGVETNPRLQQIISPSEVVAVITLTTSVGTESRGLINLCFPHMMLEPVLSQLSRFYHMRPSEPPDASATRNLRYWLEKVPVEVSVVVGETRLSVQEFLDLEVGDVLVLDRRFGEDLDVYVGKIKRYRAQPGLLGRHLAVQITGLAEGGEV